MGCSQWLTFDSIYFTWFYFTNLHKTHGYKFVQNTLYKTRRNNTDVHRQAKATRVIYVTNIQSYTDKPIPSKRRISNAPYRTSSIVTQLRYVLTSDLVKSDWRDHGYQKNVGFWKNFNGRMYPTLTHSSMASYKWYDSATARLFSWICQTGTRPVQIYIHYLSIEQFINLCNDKFVNLIGE